MKYLNRIVCVLVVICMITAALAVSAMAATSGYNGQGGTFTVTTKADWTKWGAESVTISQKKCMYSYESAFKNTDYFLSSVAAGTFGWQEPGKPERVYKEGYHTYEITVVDMSSNEAPKTYTLKDGSIKIKLEPDRTYTVTVNKASYDYEARPDLIYQFGKNITWEEEGSWWVSDTNKANCY